MHSGGEFGPHTIAFRRNLLAFSDSLAQLAPQPLNSKSFLLDPQSRGGSLRRQRAL